MTGPTSASDAVESEVGTRNAWRVLSFESRRGAEMRGLIERHGGRATVAASMREVPLEENAEAEAFATALFAGQIDVVVFMTGVGARTLLEAVELRHEPAEFFRALEKCSVVVRGPKPLAVLREWGVRVDHRVPEPNTWRELLALLDVEFDVRGKTVAVQEYGQPNLSFYEALEQRGANLLRVPVYRWALPEETGPLSAAVRDVVARQCDILLFTSANQVTNVLALAEQEGLREAFVTAAGDCLVASIGPTCSEALRAERLPVDLEASPPKMGVLVRDSLQQAERILAEKRTSTETE